MSHFLVRKLVTQPLTEVINALENIARGEGDLTQRLQLNNTGEIALVESAFNEFIFAFILYLFEFVMYCLPIKYIIVSVFGHSIEHNLSKRTCDILQLLVKDLLHTAVTIKLNFKFWTR